MEFTAKEIELFGNCGFEHRKGVMRFAVKGSVYIVQRMGDDDFTLYDISGDTAFTGQNLDAALRFATAVSAIG